MRLVAVVLLIIGLAGHLLAANAEGGSGLHYRHHIFGFVLLAVVSWIVVALLGRFFWKGRRDTTFFIVGLLQAVFGVLIFVMFTHK